MLVYCVYLISLVSLIGYYSTFNICIIENYQLLCFRLKEILKVMRKLIRINIHCTYKVHASCACVTCDLLSPCQHQLTFVSFVPCWPRLEARRPSPSAPRPRTSPWPTLTTRRWRWPAASPGWCGCWPGELGLAEESAVLLSDWSGTGPATPAMTTSWRWPRSCRSSGTRSWRRGRRGAAACPRRTSRS